MSDASTWQKLGGSFPSEGEYVWLGKPGFRRLGYWDDGWFDVSGSPLSIDPTHWAHLVSPGDISE